MRILLALTLFATACGGTTPKKESALVTEGSDSAPTCCCKTMPATAEKEIVPVYATKGRMECSGANGDCVDEVQCANQGSDQTSEPSTGTGGPGEPPPPPVLEPSTSTTP